MEYDLVDGFVDDRIVFRNGEPFFTSNDGWFTKSLEFFFRMKPHTISQPPYIISIQKNENGWGVILKEPENILEGIGLIDPEDIRKLTRQLDAAVRSGRGFDLAPVVKAWRVFKYSYLNIIYSPLLAENIASLPENLPPNDILLTYQNGKPIFCQDGKIGHHVSLQMGECWFDDCPFPVVHFDILLRTGEQGYFVKWEKSDICDRANWYNTSGWRGKDSGGLYDETIEAHYKEPDAKFDELVAMCNFVLRRGEVFDFADFIAYLHSWDKSCDLRVWANRLYFLT